MSSVGFWLVALVVGADFDYEEPGVLAAGSGSGVTSPTVWSPGIRFPVEVAPAFLNSQVWGHGGSSGPGGGQCDSANYSYPWRDNFCETRAYANALCPTDTGHQGQDIRASTCANKVHWAVAAEDGEVTNIGTYTFDIVGDSGTFYRYLHMDPATLVFDVGDVVERGDRVGLISNAFGGTPTTIHLHFETWQNVSGIGMTPVPPYSSLVESYLELLEGTTCEALPPEGGILDDTDACTTFFGNATYWRAVSDAGFGGSLRWTNAWTSVAPGNWARFRLELEEAGLYELEYFVTPAYVGSTKVPMTVAHSGDETDLVIDLTEGNGWLSLGTFDFAAEGEQWLAVYDNTGEATGSNKKIAIDALRVTRVDIAEPDSGGGDDGGDDDEGSGDPDDGGGDENGDGSDHDTPPTDPGPTDPVGDPTGDVDEIPAGNGNATGGCGGGCNGSPAELGVALFVLGGLAYRRRVRAHTSA